MGRKIPGRKHKGVKDPEKQRARRNALLKDKINAPPTVIDFQEVPKSVERITRINNAIKDGSLQLKKKKKKNRKKKSLLINTETLDEKEVKLPGMTRPMKPVPSFVQQPGESDHVFLHRIEQACHNVIQEAKFENKYGVSVNINHETGDVTVTKNPKDEFSSMEHPLQKKSGKKKLEKTSKKKEKRKAKEIEVKSKKTEMKKDDFEKFHDEVKFGEVVHAPPSFTTLPKKASRKDEAPRPGRKNLLLKTMLDTNKNFSSSPKKLRKDLSAVAKEKLEQQRKQAVDAYRMLKAQRRNTGFQPGELEVWFQAYGSYLRCHLLGEVSWIGKKLLHIQEKTGYTGTHGGQ